MATSNHRELLGPNKRNLVTLVIIMGLLATTHFLLPHPATGLDPIDVQVIQYGAYLTIFTIWMWWFVTTGIEL